MANGQTLGGNALAQDSEEKRQKQEFEAMARDAGDAFFQLTFAIDAQVRGGGQPGQFFTLMEREITKAAEVRIQALEAAGKPTTGAQRDLAKALDKIPKVPITLTTIKADERRLREQGGVSQVAVPAVRTIPQGAVESTGGVAGVRGQPPTPRAPTKPPEFVAIQNRRNQLTDVEAKLRREGRTDAMKLVQKTIKELDAKIAKEATPKEPTSTLFDIRGGKNFLKPVVSNSLRQSVARLYGGQLDPVSGKFILLDPKQGPQAVAVTALAETMILSGDETSVANAVQAAGRSFGVSFPSTEDASATEETLRQGRDSIKQGADPEAVKARLLEMGIDPDLL